jgi:hypothetical protein
MVSVPSSVNISATSYFENSALTILRGIANGSRTEYSASSMLTNVGIYFAAKSDATASIMKILLDAKGNADVFIQSPTAVAYAYTAMGNDIIDLDVAQVEAVGGGAGNDAISVKADGMPASHDGQSDAVSNVDGGAGNDNIAIDSSGAVFGTTGGDGNDIISISSHSDILMTLGGYGDDSISISSDGTVQGVSGDMSDSAQGNDSISVKAVSAHKILGGGGNDTIDITASSIEMVMGGRGDDHIILNNIGSKAATVRMNIGDGHDVIETNGGLEISRNRTGSYLDNLSDMSTATVTRNDDNSLTISFADSDDQMTVKFTGTMAEATNIVVEHDDANGTLLIRAATNEPSSTLNT